MGMYKRICAIYNATILTDEDLERVIAGQTVDIGLLLQWMVNPFQGKNRGRLAKLLDEMNNKDGLNVQKRDFTEWERSAQMILFYGYTFMVAVEETWLDATEKQRKNVDFLVRELISRINAKIKNL
jgi:hypothetical protein